MLGNESQKGAEREIENDTKLTLFLLLDESNL